MAGKILYIRFFIIIPQVLHCIASTIILFIFGLFAFHFVYSVQMAASRLINLQHHRIAQCQSIQITILGDEGVPIQVDGEAWIQPPGMIRIIHKNRAQMLCRNRSLEMSLKSWQEKQRQHSISISREQTSNMSDSTTTTAAATAAAASLPSGLMSERESYLLLNFIECASSLVSKLIKHNHKCCQNTKKELNL